MMVRLTIVMAFLSCLLSSDRPASADLLIGTLAYPRGGVYALIDEPSPNLGTEVATYVKQRMPHVRFVGTQELTPEFLSAVDILLINSASSFTTGITLTLAEQSALKSFVEGGKGAVIAADGYRADAGTSFSSPFGGSVSQSANSTSRFLSISHPVLDGPYGQPEGTTFVTDPVGVPTAFLEVGQYATVLARSNADGTGPPVIVAIPEDALMPGSGRVVLLSDAGSALNSSRTDNGMLLNAISYVSVPEPSGAVQATVLLTLALVVGKVGRMRLTRAADCPLATVICRELANFRSRGGRLDLRIGKNSRRGT